MKNRRKTGEKPEEKAGEKREKRSSGREEVRRMAEISIDIAVLSHSRGEGDVAYKVDLSTEFKGEVVHKYHLGKTYATKERAAVLAMKEALDRVKKGSRHQIAVHVGIPYVKRIFDTLKECAEREWKQKNGKDLKHADLWRHIYLYTSIYEIRVYAVPVELEGLEDILNAD